MSSSSPLTPDSGSELSELSDVESAELEKKLFASKSKSNLDSWLQTDGASSAPPAKRKREASPPHDYVLADNEDIAFIVMFRARFATAFPRFVTNFGPQDLENAVVGSPPGDLAERLLCALLALVLNRKKDIAVGSYNKALEEAISTNKDQWPSSWKKNPMTGGTTWHSMTADQRLDFLKALCLWALNKSEEIQAIIRDSYKQNRHDDDLNQPLSVQSWGRDGDKRRYWLIEGQDDTYFRLYRESNPALRTNTWWSVAGTIDEIKAFSAKLIEDGGQAAKRLSDRINSAVPRFEAGEDKRKRREYRVNRKMQFTRPEPGFSLYEGRTRGKRLRYTYSDDEDGTSDANSARRSTRNATPAEPAGLVVTASGRQVRSRLGGTYGETLHSGQNGRSTDSVGLDTDADTAEPRTRPGRGATGRHRKGEGYESDEESDVVSSGNEWNGNEEEDADDETDGDVDMDDDDEVEDGESKSLVITLKTGRTGRATSNHVNGVQRTSQAQPEAIEDSITLKAVPDKSINGQPPSQTQSKLVPMTLGLSRPQPGSTTGEGASTEIKQESAQQPGAPLTAGTPHKADPSAAYSSRAEPSGYVPKGVSVQEQQQAAMPASVNGDLKPAQTSTTDVTMKG